MTRLETTNETRAPSGRNEDRRRKRAVLLVACGVALMTVLDVSVVIVALPAMQDDLGLSPSGMQWVVSAYSVTLAGFLLLGGRAADLLGTERVFLFGLATFTGASLAGGLAVTGWQLIAARAVQGVGGAVLAPVTLTLLTRTFQGSQERARALGLWTAVAGVGGALGGVVGGLLTGFLSWRWVLIINVPVGAMLIAMSLKVLPVGRRHHPAGRLDVPGSAAVTLGSAGLVAGIGSSEQVGWGSLRTVLVLSAAILALAAFVLIERRAPDPLVPLSIFKIRPLVLADTISLLTGGVVAATFFVLSLYLQEVRGLSALATGTAMLPGAVGISLGSQLTPRLIRLLPRRTVYLGGVLLTTAGLVWLSQMDAESGYVSSLFVPSFLAMAGCGLSGLPVTLVAMSAAGNDQAGLASGLLNASRQVGTAVLLAALVAVSSTVSQQGGNSVDLVAGYSAALLVCAALVAATGVLGWWIPQE